MFHYKKGDCSQIVGFKLVANLERSVMKLCEEIRYASLFTMCLADFTSTYLAPLKVPPSYEHRHVQFSIGGKKIIRG
jgi:hypothetical protein